MSKIDINKPLELVTGETARYVRKSTLVNDAIEVFLPKRGRTGQYRNYYLETGKHIHGDTAAIRNVPDRTDGLDWSAPIQTRAGYTATVVADLNNGKGKVVRVQPPLSGSFLREVSMDGRYSRNPTILSQDDIINVPAPITKTFINIYADGSFGKTSHATFETAEIATKYGKVRVGILEQHFQNGGVVTARVIPTQPKLRTPSDPEGSNPFV